MSLHAPTAPQATSATAVASTLNVLGLHFRVDTVDLPDHAERCCWSVDEERIVISSAVPEASRPALLRSAARLIAAELSFGPSDTGGCVLFTPQAG